MAQEQNSQGSQSQTNQRNDDTKGIDLSELAKKIADLLLREIEIETERTGR